MFWRGVQGMGSKEAMMLSTITKRKWVQMQVDSYVWQQEDKGDPVWCLLAICTWKWGCLQSEGRRFEGLRVNIDTVFERRGRKYFPEKYNRLGRWGGLTLGWWFLFSGRPSIHINFKSLFWVSLAYLPEKKGRGKGRGRMTYSLLPHSRQMLADCTWVRDSLRDSIERDIHILHYHCVLGL